MIKRRTLNEPSFSVLPLVLFAIHVFHMPYIRNKACYKSRDVTRPNHINIHFLGQCTRTFPVCDNTRGAPMCSRLDRWPRRPWWPTWRCGRPKRWARSQWGWWRTFRHAAGSGGTFDAKNPAGSLYFRFWWPRIFRPPRGMSSTSTLTADAFHLHDCQPQGTWKHEDRLLFCCTAAFWKARAISFKSRDLF